MRVAISKKLRFEVFKRDLFTCKYCGSKAPDVVLEVDHVVPVASGGKNNTLNLVTSCFDCNRGKGKRELSDTSVMDKQRKQLEDIAEKREQMKMMLKWKQELSNLNEEQVDEIELLLNKKHPKYGLSESGRKKIFSLIKKHGFTSVYDATEEAVRKYYNSKVDECESFDLCYNKIELIINYSKMPEDDKKIAYIGGICKNKFSLKNTWDIKPLLKEYAKEYDLDALQKMIVNNEFSTIWQLKGFLQ